MINVLLKNFGFNKFQKIDNIFTDKYILALNVDDTEILTLCLCKFDFLQTLIIHCILDNKTE